MARLYANENFHFPVVVALRSMGHDVLTIQETGKAGQRVADDEVLDFAEADDRAVLTFNRRDFIRLHSQRPDHSGIIVCTIDSDHVALAARIDAVVASAGDLTGQLIRVNRPT